MQEITELELKYFVLKLSEQVDMKELKYRLSFHKDDVISGEELALMILNSFKKE